MSESLKDLQSMPLNKLVTRYDDVASHTVVTPSHYLAEIMRRSQDKQTETMLKYTKWVTFMTFINLIIAIIMLFK